jgi:AhpD family alkylhydroperoxidase
MYATENLNKLKLLETRAAESMSTFWAFDKAALAGGAIPRKYKELIALAAALTTRCAYCIEIHSKAAREVNASEEENAEAVVIVAALPAGAAITHGTHAVK